MARVTPRPLYLRKKRLVSIGQEAGWDPGPVCAPYSKEQVAPYGQSTVDCCANGGDFRMCKYRAETNVTFLERHHWPGTELCSQRRMSCCTRACLMRSVMVIVCTHGVYTGVYRLVNNEAVQRCFVPRHAW